MSENRPRGERGRFTPTGEATDYSRYVMGDRDRAALDAKAAHERERRAAASAGRGTPADEDAPKIRVGTQFRGQEAAALQGRLTELDITPPEYVRGLILADLGIEDTAKRRRRNYRERQQDGKTEGQQS